MNFGNIVTTQSLGQIIIAIIAFLLLLFCKKLVEWWFEKKVTTTDVADENGRIEKVIIFDPSDTAPENNPTVIVWSYNIETDINNMNFECPFRDKIFKTLLKIRCESTLEDLKLSFKQATFNEMNKEQMLTYWTEMFLVMKNNWENKFQNLGIIQIVIDKFEKSQSIIYDDMFNRIQDTINLDNIYIDNNAKVRAITDMIFYKNHDCMREVMLLHQTMNGDLIGKKMGEQKCPCDEYIKNKKCVIDLVTDEELKKHGLI